MTIITMNEAQEAYLAKLMANGKVPGFSPTMTWNDFKAECRKISYSFTIKGKLYGFRGSHVYFNHLAKQPTKPAKKRGPGRPRKQPVK